MADGINWQFAANQGNFLQQLVAGQQQAAQREAQQLHQQSVLEQLMGARDDRQFNRERDSRDFQFRSTESQRAQQNADRQFNQGDRQFGFTMTEAQRAQANADRAYGLQALAARQDDIKTVKNDDGSETLVRIPRDPNAPIQPMTLPNAANAPRNPFAVGPMKEHESKEAGYADRMAKAHLLLNNLEGVNNGFSGQVGSLVQNNLPAQAANNLVSSDRQSLMQAQRGFINALLRRESGAVISPDEFRNYSQEYFPQPGEGPEIIAQKKAARETALEALMRGAGNRYQPPKEYLTYRQQRQAQNNPNNPNPQANTPPPQANQPKVQIGSQEEYARLPSGSLFIMNGKSYQKP